MDEKLDNCCGCCKLKTGCYVLATLNLISCLAGIGICIWLAIEFRAPPFHIGTVLLAIGLIAIFGVFHGIDKEIPLIIKIWFGFHVAFAIINTVEAVASMFIIGVTGVGSFISVGLQIYYARVIYSFYKEIEQKQKPPSDVEAAATAKAGNAYANVYNVSNGDVSQPVKMTSDAVDTMPMSKPSQETSNSEKAAYDNPALYPAIN